MRRNGQIKPSETPLFSFFRDTRVNTKAGTMLLEGVWRGTTCPRKKWTSSAHSHGREEEEAESRLGLMVQLLVECNLDMEK